MTEYKNITMKEIYHFYTSMNILSIKFILVKEFLQWLVQAIIHHLSIFNFQVNLITELLPSIPITMHYPISLTRYLVIFTRKDCAG